MGAAERQNITSSRERLQPESLSLFLLPGANLFRSKATPLLRAITSLFFLKKKKERGKGERENIIPKHILHS